MFWFLRLVSEGGNFEQQIVVTNFSRRRRRRKIFILISSFHVYNATYKWHNSATGVETYVW
jgi:hypothetical protein